MKWFALAGFIATIPTANWLIGNVGMECISNGPCLVPVWPGIMAPSGVLMIGLALVLRDAVHSLHGWRWALAAIAVGAALSFGVAPAKLAVASATAFLLSEVADLLVYARLRERGLAGAVLLSSVAGAVIDSVAFLLIGFGSLQFLTGQVIGKLYAAGLFAGWLVMRNDGRPKRRKGPTFPPGLKRFLVSTEPCGSNVTRPPCGVLTANHADNLCHWRRQSKFAGGDEDGI